MVNFLDANFLKSELYNYCLAKVCALNLLEISSIEYDWDDFVPSTYIEKYNALDEYQKIKFNHALKYTSKKLKDNFNNVPIRHENHEYLKALRDNLIEKVYFEFKEFFL